MARRYARPLSTRLQEFGASINAAVRTMPRDVAARNIARQLVRCGTSPAANYGEARGAVSDRDYLFRMQICLKELRETAVWLQMALGCGFRNANYAAIERECGELTAIVTACIKKVKGKL